MDFDETLQVERLKAELSLQIEERRIDAAHALENARIVGLADQARIAAAASYAVAVIRSLFIVNGGAIVALISLISTLNRNSPVSNVALAEVGIKQAMLYYVAGLVLAVLGTGVASIAQITFIERTAGDYVSIGKSLRFLAALALVLSLGAFIMGSAAAYQAVTIHS